MSNLFTTLVTHRKVLIAILLRFAVLASIATIAAYPVFKHTYVTYFNRTVIKLHTLNISQLAAELTKTFSYHLEVEDLISLQQELNAQFGLFGFVITDCTQLEQACPEQKILFTSSNELPWKKYPAEKDLDGHPFSILQGAAPLVPDRFVRGRYVQEVDAEGNVVGRQVLGRLYLISNLPHDFDEDFLNWLTQPFRDVGPHRIYLQTLGAFLLGALLISLSLELFLAKRRLKLKLARLRTEELRTKADSYMKQMEDKSQLLQEQQEYAMEQFAAYAARIKELESRLKDDNELQSLAEDIIVELEDASRQQRQQYEAAQEQAQQELQQLQSRLVEYEQAAAQKKEELGRQLETAFRPLFTNPFEQRVYDALATSPRAASGEWRIIPNFNVGIRKNFSQFTDCLVVTTDGVIVIEAKNYPGAIVADGDPENSKWFYHNPKRREIRCPWGLNPFHQINHYCMSVLTLMNTRGRWKMPVFGVIVFPNQADLGFMGETMGSFYHLATIGKLVEKVEQLLIESRRSLPVGRRPTVQQVEDMLRGRHVS
jgi:hypothetical protein